MNQILLIGAGGHCKACIDVIEQIGEWQIAGIVDRKDSGVTEVLGYPVVGCDDDLAELRKQYEYAFVTVGQIRSAELKMKLFNRLKALGFKQPSLVSPLAYVSKHAQIGEGTIVMHHALINSAAQVDDNCIINTKALIEHDAIIEDHCHISTGAIINGGVVVGEQSFIGSHATTKQTISIPPQSFIKAGSLVK
ncbi:MAG: acetyltransferase [Shewanella sp. CG18_big_fil_WC_8_21_14_2_50_42_11]|uniref:acetyltransferase n=1 Tax=Shewanella sp. CG18_big_fil_WC_8_21_14_2_50_42_11 TaxID=1975538 RepID=UPI000C545FB5|nr:acetyltransferase [Shewanella sp. CG18_big_fil_WC_8_21_14_2_50_42_11]PIP98576.1 MAG: acetyltransferase [Shewanella sp. CG18_big_fil_WC_8_21_14_2_50_42_11]